MSFTKKSLLIILLVIIVPFVSLFGSSTIGNDLSILGFASDTNIKTGLETMQPKSGELWNYKQGLAGDITCRPVLDTIVDGVVKQIVYMNIQDTLLKPYLMEKVIVKIRQFLLLLYLII